ncbi:MAG: fumarate hydratase [Candidatus Omnitrophota bacterium]
MNKREVDTREIREAVKSLFIQANTVLREDVTRALEKLYKAEAPGGAKEMLGILVENAGIAREQGIPVCQDTGMAIVFIDIGEDVILTGENINKAVNKGVEEARVEGNLRRSVVADPFIRDNTGTNTPAVIHIEIVEGDRIGISVMPKGFGSENKSVTGMLNPTAGEEAVVDFCVEAVRRAGPDACPPYVLGVGIGGTADLCALMAKKALLRPIDSRNCKEHIACLEKRIEEAVRELDIGVMGLGGNSTVMGVNVEVWPTHIAGLPVSVNIACHALRSAARLI